MPNCIQDIKLTYNGLHSLWMHAACDINNASTGESPEIQTIFYRLVTISQMLLYAHFVFDGPQMPRWACGKHKSAPHFLTQCFQELLSAFGFTWHEVHSSLQQLLQVLTSSQGPW